MDTEASERRRYFRIKDDIVLFYKQYDEQSLPEAQTFQDSVLDSFSLTAALNHLEEDARAQLKILEKHEPDVASYLKIMDQKITLIAQSVLINDAGLSSQQTREVNLSASGLAFSSESAHPTGTILELKIILPSTLIAIATYGKVIRCQENQNPSNSEFRYNIAIDLFNIDENDRELLIRYIVKKQMLQLRNRNETA